MRKLLLFVLSLGVIAATVRGVSASTDCQRWISDYKQALAQQANTPKLLAAKRRARAYARRRLTELTTEQKPSPHPTHMASTRPHLTPAQMVKRFDVLCGDLPVEPRVLDARMAPDEFISEMSLGGPVDADMLPGEDALIAEDTIPGYDGPGVNGFVPDSAPYGAPYGPVYGGGVGPRPIPSIPSGVPPAPPVPPVPPIAPVPEPSSLLLLASGGVGLLTALRRRVV